MILLARAKSASHFLSSSGKHLFSWRHYITPLQQCNFYATKITLTKPRIQKPRLSPPALSQGPTTVWPKPGKIPYQAKVANFVNLVGNVETPVQFESDSDGKHFASTVISVGNGEKKYPLVIPIVCEGDLAHSVACHVKQDNRVFVAGQLSADPLRLVPIKNIEKFHVVAENVCFVVGFEKVVSDKVRVSISGVETNGLCKGETSLEPLPESATLKLENVQKSGDKGGKSVTKKITPSAERKAKLEDSWKILLENPLQWVDYRNQKTDGLVKREHPDFKQKETHESLWIRNAPKWALAELGKLECDQDFKLKPEQVRGGINPSAVNKKAKLADSWQNLVENPKKWWDNRVGKKNPKGPDFKHKETGEVLWLNTSPEWALSKLPPLKDGEKPPRYWTGNFVLP